MASPKFDEFKSIFEQPPAEAADQLIPVKGGEGPRFAEKVDAPVTEHVPGATAVAAPRAKAKRPARVEGPPPDPLPLDPEMVERVVAFAIEREAIRKRKEAGGPKPWTDDPILHEKRFCNIHREDDAVTRWVTKHIVEPNRNDQDLWFRIATARLINQPDTLIELLDYLAPFEATHVRTILEVREARGKTIWRGAYHSAMARAGQSRIDRLVAEILGPMWRNREELRPRPGDTLGGYSDRLRVCAGIDSFLAAQFIADLKYVAPLSEAPDWWTFALFGTGSKEGLNYVCKRKVKASWSEPLWYATLLELNETIAPRLEAAGIARLDMQNVQNVLCEFSKYERWRAKGIGELKATKPKASPKLATTPRSADKATAAEREHDESARNSSTISTEAPNPPPAHILEDTARAPDPPPKTERAESTTNGRDKYPHGEDSTGTKEGFYIYLDARGRHYLGVQRTSTKQFPQFHWNGTQWVKGLPKGFVKIPYKLPELLDASADTWIVIAAGEKDAETAARLGFVATTNSGGEGKGQWTLELNRWFAGKQRVAVMEDHDDTGKAHAIEVANALCGIVPDIRIVTFRELPEHGDLTDWIDGYKHSKNDLLARIKATAPYNSELDEWDAGELLSNGEPIKPRQWLLARCFCRTFLSGLVAPGDAGKTTLRLTQAVELATGRELLGHHIYQRSRVLVISLEDDREELRRRLAAICKHHDINPVELKGWLFCRDLKRVKLATRDKNGERQTGPLESMLRRAIARTRCDLLILDPFVKLHALVENDNADMDFVCEQLIAIAQGCNIAVDSPAHTHKGAIAAGDADARRGASAQRDAGRLDYTFTVMSEDEAEKFGIHPDERKSYVRLDKAKANLTRAIKAEWFKLVSVSLGNVTDLYPEGDAMQAIERWTPPETWGDVSAEALNAILNETEAEMPAGRRYSGKPQATDRAAWRVVQKYCPTKTEAQCREMIREWIKAGVLFEAKYHDPVSRKEEWGLFVDRNKRPQY